VVSIQALRAFRYLHPATAVIVCAILVVLVGGYLTYARVSGTRHLPEHIHRGLMPDHRNYALGWLAGAAFAAMPLAMWAAAAPPDQGQSWPLSVGLALFSLIAIGMVLWLWTGPFPNLFPSTTAWLDRRRNSRRT
jgi:hypothetical protein